MTTLADDGLAQMMRRAGIEVNRASYITAAYGDTTLPETWTIENEMELPEELRDFSWLDEEHPHWDEGIPAPGAQSAAKPEE